MERVRVVVFGCLLALGLSFCPSAAYASDGFVGGLQDLVGVRDVEDNEFDYEREYEGSYQPSLRAGESDEIEIEEGQELQSVINASTNVPIGSTFRSIIPDQTGWSAVPWMLRAALTSDGSLVGITVLLVFMWWGVRKALRIVMSSFRKGRASV